jgi:peptidoglycan/LPS O-acetylase OafA/YrhL
LADEYAQLGKHVASGAAFILNFILVDESGYFDNAAETKPMLHLWSLAVEEQFYIIWPLVLWFAWKRQFNLLIITLFVALLSFYLNLKFVVSKPTETFFWPVGRFWELLSGSILAWLLLYKRDLLANAKLWVDKYLVRLIRSKEVAVDGSTTANVLSFCGLLLLIYGVIRIHEGLAFPSQWALIPILGALLVISAGSKAWFNRFFLMNPIAVWFGLISYPLYLWHWPILSFLQVIVGEFPQRDARILAVLLSIFLAWGTFKFIERPIRFGKIKRSVNPVAISALLFAVGVCGYFVSKADLSRTHGYEDILFKRKGFEHAFGSSLAWYRGKDDWLFLGNKHSNTVAKRKLVSVPTNTEIEKIKGAFSALSEVAAESDTQVALFVGPNKSSVYSEYLPEELVPSEKRYSTFFTDSLKEVPNLIVYDPTDDLLRRKHSEGLVYYRTNTHWNSKGAFLAYSGFLNLVGLPVPGIEFQLGSTHRGDLIGISKLSDFPLHADDNWSFVFKNGPELSRESIPDQPKDSFGAREIVTNQNPLSDQTVWVVGDSFTTDLRPYLNATFKAVHYLGHWDKKLNDLPLELRAADKKPDMVLVVRVERSF